MDEEYKVRFIPPNFENGINILGLNFSAVFLIEGGILGIAAFLGAFLLLRNGFGITDIGRGIGYSLALGGIVAFVGVRGLNDEPISTFTINLIKFAKNKRTTYYNPRVKEEAVSYADEQAQKDPSAEVIPRERILALIDEIKDKHPGAYVDESVFNPDIMQFAEDKALEEKQRQEEKEKKGGRKRGKKGEKN